MAITNATGSPTPLPSISASGTLPTIAASGAAAAITRKTTRPVLSDRRLRPETASATTGAESTMENVACHFFVKEP